MILDDLLQEAKAKLAERRLADPKLVEYGSGKVRFAPGSPAETLGIEPIDVSGAGCSRDSARFFSRSADPGPLLAIVRNGPAPALQWRRALAPTATLGSPGSGS